MVRKILSLLFITFLLTSCTVGPNYVRPGVVVPSKFKEAKGKAFVIPPNKGWKIAEPKDEIQRTEWWRIFNDPHLNALEEQLLKCNQTIANALANYLQARQIVNQATAGFYPTLTGGQNFQKQKLGSGSTIISTTTGTGTSTGTATTGNVVGGLPARSSFTAFFDVNWEPDIWGLVRRTVEGDISAAQASQALLAATRLSAQGSLAQYYFQEAALDRDQQLLDKTVADYKIALQLTRNQYNSGVAARADIVQAQSQLEIAQAQAINNHILRAQYEHAIAVLIGRPPADFSMPFRPLNTKPPIIPVAVPTCWLERRPDIAQAERLMQQANAQIGIAYTAYFPTFNISASGSGGASTLGELVTSPIIGWAFGYQLIEIIFDGGLRTAIVNAAKTGYMAQVANYRQVVLAAFQDVEDNLVALRTLEKQGIAQNKAAISANTALKLVINQYKSGTVPYSSVITAQITAFTAQKNAYDVVGLQMTAAVNLVKSLGGGWSTHDIAPVRNKYEGYL